MTSRYGRPLSPTGAGRRYADPARTSTGSVFTNYDMPSSYRHRDSFTSPRTSGERVVPISSETYINGQRVNAPTQSRSSYDAYDPRPRRSTYDEPAVVHHSANRGVDPASRSSNYDSGRYVSSSSAPKREHKKVYSVGDGKTTRLVPAPEKDLPARRESTDSRLPPPSSDRGRRDYHLSGPAKKVAPNDEGGGYEYTDARGMYRDTEPKWRSRRGSVDGVGRERPSSWIEPYSSGRNAPRDQGPPPAVRGFDRITTNPGRHGSVTGSVTSPSRYRDRGYGSTSSGFSEDENYRVAPRIMPASRADTAYKLPSEQDEIYSPSREDFNGRRQSRGLDRRFEDADVTVRGFGIRAPSIEPRRSREDSVDRYSAYNTEPFTKFPPRDYPRDRESARGEAQREMDRRERERERDRNRDTQRVKKESPPLLDGDLAAGRHMPREPAISRDHPAEREVIQPRNAVPQTERSSRDDITDRDEIRPKVRDAQLEKAREPVSEEPRRDREQESLLRSSREQGPRADADRPGYDRQGDRDLYIKSEREVEEQRRPKDIRDEYEESLSHSPGSVGNGLSGAAAVGAAAYGVKQMRDRRENDDTSTNGRIEKQKVGARDARDLEPTSSGSIEGRRQIRAPDDRGVAINKDNLDRAKVLDNPPEDIDPPRRRNYIGNDSAANDTRQSNTRTKQSEPLDPEEDYRRRVQQEAERVQMPYKDDDRAQHESDEGRERRRTDRDTASAPDRDDIDQRTKTARAHDDDSASDHSRDAQALTRYKPASDESSDTRFVDEPSEIQPRKNRVSIVEPPKEKEKPKGILRKPTDKFPEDPNPVREGVAPLKDGKTKDVPSGARWTKINRSMVNPEALEEAQERFEERQEHVIVLRVLTREEIQKFADRTKEIRDARYERDHKEKRGRRDGRRDHEGTEEARDDEGDRTRSIGFDR